MMLYTCHIQTELNRPFFIASVRKDDNGKTAIQNVMGPNGSFVQYNLNISTDKYEKTNQKENSNKGYAFREGRDELFPIPNSEITMSEGSIQQNPLY